MKLTISHLRRIIREAIEEIEEAEKDLNKDGKNDFTDVMIARMKASGVPKKVAIKRGEKAAAKATKTAKK